MYIDYSKLWKLLIDKDMSKSDLLELTGISSRVLAKLTKNETVTTDTIARICTALDCDVSEIMECVSEERLSIYACYKKHASCVEESEQYKIFCFEAKGEHFRIFVSAQVANKHTHIHCEEKGGVYWEQFYPVSTFSRNSVKNLLVKPPRTKDETVIVLIKGKPSFITGLDENGFASARGGRKSQSDVFVMSEAAFKLFELK